MTKTSITQTKPISTEMLNQVATPPNLCFYPYSFSKLPQSTPIFPSIKPINCHFNTINTQLIATARRRIIEYDEEEEEDGEYGHNEEIAMLELYSLSARDEALLVQAVVDGQQVEILIFKGFSSSLSYKTWADPSKSVIPARGVIKSIDRVKGPFDPSNIQYLEKGLSWDTFKSRITRT